MASEYGSKDVIMEEKMYLSIQKYLFFLFQILPEGGRQVSFSYIHVSAIVCARALTGWY